MSFFRNLGLAAGNAILVGTEIDAKQAETETNLQVAAGKKMAAMAAEKEANTARQIGEYIRTEQAADASTVQDPLKASDLYAKGANMAVLAGSFESAKKLSDLAHGEATRSKAAVEAVSSKVAYVKENLASASMDYLANPTAEAADRVARSAVAAGVNPLELPPPNSPAFKTWAKAQQDIARTAHQRLTASENVQQFHTQETRRNSEFEQRLEANRIARQAIADAREAEQNRKDDARKEARTAQLTTKLNSAVQREAAPYLKDMEVANTLRGFLSANSPTADQQVQQILPSLLGSLKGRATNPYYKDNKFYGDLVQKFESATSRIFTGRYSEQDRKQMMDMLDVVEREINIPALNRLEQQQKRQAVKLGADPDAVEILGGFPRTPGISTAANPPSLPEKQKQWWEVGKKPKAQGVTGSWGDGMTAQPTPAQPASAPTTTAPITAEDEASARLREDVRSLNAELGRATGRGQREVLEQELRSATAKLTELEGKPAAPQTETAPITIVLRGATYIKRNGEWKRQ